MTKNQNGIYWREWSAVRHHLMDDLGWKSSAADSFRHTLHIRALGFDKSHLKFNNRDFDAILGVFRAISRADDIEAQLRQLEQPLDRCRRALRDLQADLEMSDEYVDGIAWKITHKAVMDCNEAELSKVISALNFHRYRLAKQAAACTTSSKNPF